MLNVVYLVLVMNTYGSAPTSQMIPQASTQQCMLNKKAYDGKELKSATTTANDVQIRATCIVGVMSK
jgi:hypothetical protein